MREPAGRCTSREPAFGHRLGPVSRSGAAVWPRVASGRSPPTRTGTASRSGVGAIASLRPAGSGDGRSCSVDRSRSRAITQSEIRRASTEAARISRGSFWSAFSHEPTYAGPVPRLVADAELLAGHRRGGLRPQLLPRVRLGAEAAVVDQRRPVQPARMPGRMPQLVQGGMRLDTDRLIGGGVAVSFVPAHAFLPSFNVSASASAISTRTRSAPSKPPAFRRR